jgi:mannosyltransferase
MPRGRGPGSREGTAVPDTEIGSDDPAAVAPARPHGPAARLTASRDRAGWLVIAVPAVTAFVVGGYELGGPSLWRDEAYTKDAIGRSVSQLFAMLGNMDAVHGAYYLLMHVIAAVIGTSAVALRFPSLCAMVIAAGFTAAIGRRTAALALVSRPGAGRYGGIAALTGLASGLVFATAPLMTYYAQMARSYAIVTMFATIATYLLLRAYPDGRWRYWSAYAAAVALTGLFNLFGLLIIVAHGVTLLLTDARARTGIGRRVGRLPLRWLAACTAAVLVLSPLLAVASGQQQQIQWLVAPDYRTINRLVSDFAGSHALRAPVALLVLVALAGRAALRADRLVLPQAGLRGAVRRVLPARAGHRSRRRAGRDLPARRGRDGAHAAAGLAAAGLGASRGNRAGRAGAGGDAGGTAARDQADRGPAG